MLGRGNIFPPRPLFAPPYLPQGLLEAVTFEGPNLDEHIIARFVPEWKLA